MRPNGDQSRKDIWIWVICEVFLSTFLLMVYSFINNNTTYQVISALSCSSRLNNSQGYGLPGTRESIETSEQEKNKDAY